MVLLQAHTSAAFLAVPASPMDATEMDNDTRGWVMALVSGIGR